MAILRSVLIVAVAVIALWLLSGVIGFEMALGVSLLVSVLLTLGLNLLLSAGRR